MTGRYITPEERVKPVPVYFDTNVFGDLTDVGNPDTSEWLRALRIGISEHRVRIILSFENLQELLIGPEHKSNDLQRCRELCREIADWLYLLKPAHELFEDDILSFARTGGPSIPFVRPGHELWEYIDPIRFGQRDLLRSLQSKDCLSRTMNFERGFVNSVLKRANPDRAKSVRSNIKRHQSNPESQWKALWDDGATAEIMARDFADRLNVLPECEERGLDQLLRVPTVRMTLGYTLHAWYMQIIQQKTSFQPSDAMDSRHATCAGAVGNIVTTDRRFRAAIEHVPDHGVRVRSLNELVSELQGTVS